MFLYDFHQFCVEDGVDSFGKSFLEGFILFFHALFDAFTHLILHYLHLHLVLRDPLQQIRNVLFPFHLHAHLGLL